LTSRPGSVLFDKGVIRRVYERRVRLAAGRPPTLLQFEAAGAYARVASFTNSLWITEQTANILHLRTRVTFYFARPYHSWERGSNENANGLIRQYLPKGVSMAGLSQRQCNAIAKRLNTRPRKRLGFRTPLECFDES